jgi:hypothetical protein
MWYCRFSHVRKEDRVTEPSSPEATGDVSQSGGRGRGRPRPLETIKLDEAVLAVLSDGRPRTRREIADAVGVEKQSIAYLALYRLRLAGRVKRAATETSRFGWTIV